MHAELELGDSKLMVGQANNLFTPRTQATYVYVPDVDAVYKRAIAAGARSLNEVADQFYGDRSGGFEDPAGNFWWVATHVEDVSEEELTRRARAQESSTKDKVACVCGRAVVEAELRKFSTSPLRLPWPSLALQ